MRRLVDMLFRRLPKEDGISDTVTGAIDRLNLAGARLTEVTREFLEHNDQLRARAIKQAGNDEHNKTGR